MITIAEDLGQHVGVKRACEVLGVPRSSLYRDRQPKQASLPRLKPARALSEGEREGHLQPRSQHLAPES